MSELDDDIIAIKQVRNPVMPQAPEAKVTIFIEIGDRIKKIEIPHARYLDIESRHRDMYGSGFKFSFSCEPQYDIDRNHYLTEEIRTVIANEFLREDVWPVGRAAAEEDRAAKRKREKWANFEASNGPGMRKIILDYGPSHPHHPDHEHEDCCK